MRTIQVPLPVPLLDPMTDKPVGTFFAFGDFARALFLHPDIVRMGDVLSMLDLRTRCIRAVAETPLELDEQGWQTLCALAKQPVMITPQTLPAIVPFVRAILEAQAS